MRWQGMTIARLWTLGCLDVEKEILAGRRLSRFVAATAAAAAAVVGWRVACTLSICPVVSSPEDA